MDLSRVLSAEVVLVPLEAAGDDDALRQLVERLAAAADVGPAERIVERLTEESALRATLVGNGAGIVHTRLEELTGPVAALGVLAPGRSLHLGATLQFVVNVIFLVLSPVEPPEPHLELITAIATLVRDEAALNRLRGAADPAQAIAALKAADANAAAR